MNLKVWLVAAELNPIAKVGGLGDVIGALPKALFKLGVDVRIITGYYGTHNETLYPTKIIGSLFIPWGEDQISVKVRQTTLPKSKVIVYLVDEPNIIGNGGVYDSPTAMASGQAEIQRFLLLSKAATHLSSVIGEEPDVWHLHDWHASAVTQFLKKPHSPTLLTIHNLANQGWARPTTLTLAGLNARGNKDTCLFRLGLESANFLSTVSPNYALEIQSAPGGEGFEDILHQRRHELVGITNGIDTEIFNPATDPNLTAHYDVNNASGKLINKKQLKDKMSLELMDVPLFGIVSRLTDQKGIELITQTVEPLLKEHQMQFVFLGAGDPQLEQNFNRLAKTYPGWCAGKIGFDAPLAQHIYAGSDFFLMPSRFEPCGLGQLIAMRYGTIPLVRATGGLKDTVIDMNEPGGNGLMFDEYTSDALYKTIWRALALYSDRAKIQVVIAHAMKRDSSWDMAARTYLNLYQRLCRTT